MFNFADINSRIIENRGWSKVNLHIFFATGALSSYYEFFPENPGPPERVHSERALVFSL